MCGRYELNIDRNSLYERYRLKGLKNGFSDLEEVFPSNAVPVIIGNSNRELKILKWGFSPSFSKRLLINARSETVDVKPTFRESFFNRRCLIPATGFYEWKKDGDKKVKYSIKTNDHIFSMAGVYSTFKDKDGKFNESFTILTRNADSKMKSIHHRMPVIIKREYEEIWNDNNIKDKKLLKKIIFSYDGDLSIRAL